MSERVLAGRFHLDRLLGRGGMAEVYEAYDENLDRQVAIKVLLPRFSDDEAFQERFTDEGRKAAGLNHPNIVTVLDTGLDRETGLRFIVMELVQGRSLQEAIRAGGLTEQRALEVCGDVCGALQYAHERGLVHRDIKPGNILLADDGSVKVTDFGIARAIDSDSNVTQTAAVLGTAAYLSPEQAQGRPVDARSDVYSLGVVLYELLTGKQPFQGDTPVTVAYQHVQEPARPPRDLNPTLTTPAEAICVRAMAKNPANRYQSAGEFREDLLRALSGHDVVAPAVMRADETALLDPVTPSSATGPRTERRRRVVGYALLGLGSVVAAALAMFVLLNSFGGGGDVDRTVPDVRGRSRIEAEQVLRSHGLRSRFIDRASNDVPEGRVFAQDPPPDDTVPQGTTVVLSLSSGPEQVAVPDLSGATEDEAVARLRELNLTPVVRDEPSEEVEQGMVVRTEPEVDARVPAGTTVEVIISSGQSTLRVPPLVGLSESEARLLLTDRGFRVLAIEKFHPREAGIVVAQEPAPGEEVAEGSEVTITVSKGPEETETPTPTDSPSPTGSPTPSDTPSPTPSPTPTDSPTPEPTETGTSEPGVFG